VDRKCPPPHSPSSPRESPGRASIGPAAAAAAACPRLEQCLVLSLPLPPPPPLPPAARALQRFLLSSRFHQRGVIDRPTPLLAGSVRVYVRVPFLRVYAARVTLRRLAIRALPHASV